MEILLSILILGLVLAIMLSYRSIEKMLDDLRKEIKSEKACRKYNLIMMQRETYKLWDFVAPKDFGDYIHSPYFSDEHIRPKDIIRILENAGFVRDENKIINPTKRHVDDLECYEPYTRCPHCGRDPGDGDTCQRCGAPNKKDYRVWMS